MAERNWHTLECLADGDDCDGGDGVDDGDADDIARSARTFNKPNQSSPNREQMQFAM